VLRLQSDLEELHHYILLDNPVAADRFVERLESAIEQLARHPELGHTREDLTSRPVLFWPVGSYLIVYRHDREPIHVIAVLHAARDVASILSARV
jgi:plasmid stabilization system protein ParE